MKAATPAVGFVDHGPSARRAGARSARRLDECRYRPHSGLSAADQAERAERHPSWRAATSHDETPTARFQES